MPVRSDVNIHRQLATATLVALIAALAIALVWTRQPLVITGGDDLLRWLRTSGDRSRVIVTVVFTTFALLGYLAVWAKVSAPRRAVRLADGRGTIAVDVLAERLRLAILERPDVEDAGVRVDNLRGRGVRVVAVIAVTANARLAETVEAATMAIERALDERAGVPLAEPPALELRYEELILDRPRRKASDAA
ncbi:MAG TPA: hypothetical protein QGI71_00735 [Dehalococcoidia bacterium]|nr:hypothetical protein [Dehalococcoidia bacterium]